MDKVNELREKRAKLIEDARAIQNKADTESRSLTAEEVEQFERIEADDAALKVDIDRREKLADDERALRESRDRQPPPRNDPDPSDDDPPEQRSTTSSPEYAAAFRVAMREGRSALSREERMVLKEARALQVGTDSEGGYLVPNEHLRVLIEAKEAANVMRTPGLCTIVTTSSGTTDFPVVSSRGAAAWDAEEAAFEEADDAFGQVTMSAYKMTRIIKVADELLADSQFPIEPYLSGSFGKSFGDLEETAFVAGDGSSKPTGIVNGSTLGKTAAGVAAITADELFDLYHSLGQGYRRSGTFMSADLTIKSIRKLKDGNGQYLWQAGLQAGQPDTLLGRPILSAADMPAMTTGLKSMIFGDFSYYWIADRSSGTVLKRLEELYAANGQVGFAAYQRVDGKLTLATAVYHLIQA